jgi:hypothetical protein
MNRKSKLVNVFIIAVTLYALTNLISCGGGDNCNLQDLEKGTIEYDPNELISLGCMSGGLQYFSATQKRAFFNVENQEVLFLANGDVNKKDESSNAFIPYKFKRVHALSPDATTKRNLNGLLEKAMKNWKEENFSSYQDVKLIRLLSNAGFSYEIAFFQNQTSPAWVLVCKTYCNNDEPILLKIKPKQ